MSTPEQGFSEGLEAKEQEREFEVRFPDGSIGRFRSREEAADAIREWREAA